MLGAFTPRPEMRKKLEILSAEMKLNNLGGIADFVRNSPYQIIITDQNTWIVAASKSSGFQEGMRVIDQVPESEKSNFIAFTKFYEKGGFWMTAGTVKEYVFKVGAYESRAIVTSVLIDGSMFALVQRTMG
jgi:hypothetical protein